MGKLIQKSVRLPEELVAYIETQRGSCFSQKLVRYLEYCIRGAAPEACRELSRKLDNLERDLERSVAVTHALSLDFELLADSAERVGVRGNLGGCQGDVE